MKKIIDKMKPKFEVGGKLHRWRGVFDSFYTFFYVPADRTKFGCHIRDGIDMKRTMTMVILALIPATLFGMWNIGFQHYLSIGEEHNLIENFSFGFFKLLPLIIVSYASGLGLEFLFVFIKNKEIEEGFLVSGILIPLIVPIDVPLWMLSIATIFAVLIGKEIFGGTGMNIVNPALLTRAFLFFSYPSWMSGDKVWIEGLKNGENIVDGFSGATPLAQLAENKDIIINGINENILTPMNYLIGNFAGSVGETSFIAIMLGALFLIFTGVGSFRIMASVFVGGYLTALLFNFLGNNELMLFPAHLHLMLGGFAFGAVFMATDPVTASQTNRGKYIYGFLIGVLAIMIRVVNPAYPEGVMLAILLMNIFAPLIDHFVVQSNIKKRLARATKERKLNKL